MGNNTEYINTVDYKDLSPRIKDLVSAMDEMNSKSIASRRLRYVKVDVEREKADAKLQPDELFVPQHVIDTNIRREQSSYVQYVTQSPRAVILQDKMTPGVEPTLLEKDVSNRLRYDGWQMSLYPCIDGMQQNGYGVMEVVYDESKPGHVAHEFVQLGDFGYIADTRNIQEAEMVCRAYYFSRTKLKALGENQNSGFSMEQIKKVIGEEPRSDSDSVIDSRDASLYRIDKVMFRIKGIVQVAWTKYNTCDNWLKPPVPLFIGRREPDNSPEAQQVAQTTNVPPSKQAKETEYPYTVFAYLISENDTISELIGRVFLDQDCQEAATSLMSSFCTAHRRAANMYFSKDADDPNADLTMQKNVYFEPGALINAKIKQFQLVAPDAEVMQAIQAIVAENQNETSQVNFAAQNRKDSRKTATEITAATQSAAALSTVQVVLFSWSLRNMYSNMYSIIRSRVLAGLITDVAPEVKPMYAREYQVKPSGDTDVIERQQLIMTMMQAWPVMQSTAAAVPFLCDMLQKMFPDQAMKYIQLLQQAQQQQQAQQAQQQSQQMQMILQAVMKMVTGIEKLAEHPEMFSDTGRIHALPVIEETASQITQLKDQMSQQQKPQQQQPPKQLMQ